VRPYDVSFRPPAPVAELTIVHPTDPTARASLPGKMDTGADVTVIPTWLAAELGLQPKGRAWTRGFDGSYSQRLVYYPSLVVEGKELSAVRCVSSDRPNVLLGRNVLNRFVIVLNGPDLQWEMQRA
jgi:predicted aspartyl protease